MANGLYERLESSQENLTRAQRIGIAILCCLLLCFFVATIVLAFSSGGGDGKAAPAPHHGGGGSPQPRVNNSAGWKRAAAYILQGLDETVEPCDDFYKFACNNIIKKVPKNKTENVNFAFDANLKKVLLEFAKSKSTEPFPLDMLKNALSNCINMNDKLELEEMNSFVNRQMDDLGGFPLREGAVFNETSFQLFSTLVAISKMPVETAKYVGRFVLATSHNGPKVLQLDGFPLTTDFFERYVTGKLENLQEFRKNFSINFGITLVDDNSIISALNNITTMLEDLQQAISFGSGEQAQVISLGKLKSQQFEDLYDAVKTKLTTMNLSDDTPVKLQPISVRIIAGIVQKYRLELQTLLLMSFADGYVEQVRDTHNGTTIFGQRLSREDFCIAKIFSDDSLQKQQPYWMLASHLLAKRANLTEKSLRVAEQLLADIRITFQRRLSKLPWLTLRDYRLLSARVRTVTSYVGLPEWLFSLESMKQVFQNFEIQPGTSFMRGAIETTRFYKESIYYAQLLPKKELNVEFWMDVIDYPWMLKDAFYLKGMRLIMVLMGMVEEPTFEMDFPSQLNYGALGQIIGHEFMHGFDWPAMNDSGIKLSQKAAEKLTLDFDCIVQQYGKISYTINGTTIFLNGSKTIRENIADNGGIGLAYHSFLRHRALQPQLTPNSEEDQRMPGLEAYDSKQTFFLAMARTACDHLNDEDLKKQIDYDPHPPFQTRVTQTLKNFPPFATAFGCKLDSPMNPKPADRCSVW